MKQTSETATISLLLLLVISTLRPTYQLGESRETRPNEISFQKEDTFSSLMGSEECADTDEGCQMRRMVAEAHLDYIYTQKRQP